MREVKRFKDNHAVASAFAKYLLSVISSNEVTTIALSGGSTPKLLFKILAEEYADSIPWQKVHFFWGDERCVPPTHEESNYKMTKEFLFDHIGIDPNNIHRVYGESDPEEEAKRYSALISTICHSRQGLPAFDLIILGMGDDGHTASIFPHQMELLDATGNCAVATHPVSGQKRVTLTGPVINNAQEVCFLVTGENKAEKISEIFKDQDSAKAYPASHIHTGKLKWFIDEDAYRLVD